MHNAQDKGIRHIIGKPIGYHIDLRTKLPTDTLIYKDINNPNPVYLR